MNGLDFTKGFWTDVQFRVKTLEELEEFNPLLMMIKDTIVGLQDLQY